MAIAWLLLLILAAVHVVASGLPVATDLMALLPREDRDPAVQRAKDAAARALSERIVVLVGHPDRDRARAAAATIERGLAGLLRPGSDVPDRERLGRLGAALFPHRAGLLAEADRRALSEGRGEELAARALSQVFGVGGFADSRLLRRDPFLLFPAFMAGLPVPASRLALDEGRPTVVEDGTTWVLVTGRLAGEANALEFQRRFTAAFDAARAKVPEAKVLRLGTVFYAHAGAGRAMAETSLIGGVSLVGTALLLVLAFRRLQPLLLGVGAILAGLVAALSVSIALFGELHLAAQLFGASLIGIAADYALLYFAQAFSDRARPADRLRHVLPGITLGTLTTMVGYLTLAVSPFPGLRQVAVFSVVGLAASYLTVVLWFPLLDRTPALPLGRLFRSVAGSVWRLWGKPRPALAVLAVLLGGLGFWRIEADDDIRRQQALDTTLAAEQAELQRLTGFGQAGGFFVVQGADQQEALRRAEALGDRLAGLANWQSPARFAPSAARQAENRALVAERLAPHLPALRQQLGMPEPEPAADTTLALAEVAATGAIPLLDSLVVEDGLHLVLLDSVPDLRAVRAAAEGLAGVRFVDATADWSELLASYRRRAVLLLAASALLMLPLLWKRYGLGGALRVLAPPAAAVALSPALLALLGQPFSFFSAMALVMVLSIGVDYAVFFAEDRGRRDSVTLTAVLLAAATTLLSFGLLALSGTAGVRGFGLVMLAGLPLAFLLAPLAGHKFKV